ncbi:MAG: disulfide bond formation protein B [Microthrixaceae bacterium]
MSVDVVSTFLALLAVLGLVFVAVVIVLGVVAKVSGGLPAAVVPWRDSISELALPLGFAVALTTTLGSLYMSQIAKFPPCELCWFQRICMYPNVILFAVAWWRRDRDVRFYVLPLVLIGICISTYHYLLERFPDSVSYSCTNDIPCETVWVWKFHFLSIPGMAWVGFALLATLSILARPRSGSGTGDTVSELSTSEEVPQ